MKNTAMQIKHITINSKIKFKVLFFLSFKEVHRHLPLMLHNTPKNQMVGITFPL